MDTANHCHIRSVCGNPRNFVVSPQLVGRMSARFCAFSARRRVLHAVTPHPAGNPDRAPLFVSSTGIVALSLPANKVPAATGLSNSARILLEGVAYACSINWSVLTMSE